MPRRLARAVTFASAAATLLAVVAVAAGYAFLGSDAGVAFALRELAARSGGRLIVEGATGSLLDAVHARRIAWQGPAARFAATDVVLTWSPTALWSRGIVVHTLGAQRIELDVEPSGTDVAPPESLALPFEIAVDRLAVEKLDWRVGPNRGTLSKFVLRYAGGAAGHRVTDLALGGDAWSLAGRASIGAAAPFPVAGELGLAGADRYTGVASRFSLSGTLAALVVDGSGDANGTRFELHAALAPLTAVPFSAVALDASGLDLRAWDEALPASRLGVVVRAQPAGGGIAGTLALTNDLAGTLDAGRIPVRTLAARFAWQESVLVLDAIDAGIAGGGSARGSARIPLAAGAGAWTLALAGVDLSALYAPLAATRLSGRVDADLARDRQTIRGEIADQALAGGIRVDFAAAVAASTLTVERLRARAGDGTVEGRGRVGLTGERAFALDATATRLDPARFGAFPAGALDGQVVASGTAAGAWRADVALDLAAGSKLSGVALSGKLTGDFSRDAVRNASLVADVGGAKLAANGSAGAPGDVLAATLDAPRLAGLVPLLPAAVPRTLTGSLAARMQWRGPLAGGGIELHASGSALTVGQEFAARTLDLDLTLAAAAGRPGGDDFATRELRLDARAADLRAPPGTFRTARASLAGTLARHTLGVDFDAEDIALAAAAGGGFVQGAASTPGAGWRWSGTLDKLDGKGPLALSLTAPAGIELAPHRVRIGETRLAIADGTMRIADFTWEEGRITTHGSVKAVPLATLARIAGRPLPAISTLTFGGEWSVAATPRLNGTISLQREGGDLVLEGGAQGGTPVRQALGITTLELVARLTDDAVAAEAKLVAKDAGSATASLTLGVAPGAPPGRIGADAPLTLSATADLPTLRLLQPWIGTTAVVGGRARVELAAGGTRGRMALTGAVTGDALRVDAPQYGMHFKDGRIRARYAEGRLSLEEFVLGAGAGEFRASGTAVAAAAGAPTDARIGWRATRFRLFNRPDLNLVVDGEGTLALAKGKLVLNGNLRADEGHIVYASDAEATLGSDVVVKGWPPPAPSALRSADLPLVVDLELDFGERLHFESEGLVTGLEGTVRVTTSARGFVGKGTIRSVNGTYRAFGQKLVIDPGRLVFDGPLDNPGLDIIALRRNLAVEAGVAVTGTVRVPIIQLTSNPPVSDSERLAWLVLGHGLDRTSGSELSALQAASALLMGRNSKPIGSAIAESVGVDEIAFRTAASSSRSSARGASEAESGVIAVGKRLTDRLTLVYEQGLSVANSALRIEYALTRNLRLSASTGVVTGIGIQYSKSWD